MNALQKLIEKARSERTPLEQCIVDAAIFEEAEHDGDFAIMEQAADDFAALKVEIAESNQLLRSAYAVAARAGDNTNWVALRQQLNQALQRQHDIMRKYDIKPL